MSSSVDNRVVSMRFDNQAFEQRIGTSINSLSKLKTGMNFEQQTKGLQSLQTAGDHLNLGGIASSVEHISSKFSAMGVVGLTTIASLTRAALDFVKNTASTILDPIFTGGKERAEKIDQAKFAFRGLGLDVTKGMQSALDAVKGTAFGLDDAAKIAAQLGASGIKVGGDMTSVLRGIAGAAALTGSSFGEIGDIFAGSAASGKVTNQDLLQFATRGLNAAAAVGKVMGKSEAQVHEMATNGTLDFKTFSDAMNKAFGEHATKANETYSGSLANMRTAMSRLGASFFTPVLETQKNLFNAITPVIDNVNSALLPLTNSVAFFYGLLAQGAIEKLSKVDLSKFGFGIKIIADALNKGMAAGLVVLRQISAAFKEVFPTSIQTTFVNFTVAFHKLIIALTPAPATLLKIKAIFVGVFSAISIGIAIVKAIAGVFETLFKSFEKANGGKLLDFFVKVADKVTALRKVLVDGGGIQQFFDKFINPIASFIGQLDFAGAIQKVIDQLIKVKDAIFGFFSSDSDKVSKGSDRMAQAADRVSERWSFLVTVGQKLADVGKVIAQKLSEAFDQIKKFLGSITDAIIDSFSGSGAHINDVLNTGLFAVLVLAFKQFVNTGFKFDIGNGLFANISKNLNELQGTLKTMQATLKAEALQKLAIAIAILAGSVVVLSLIDPVKLTGALTAMAAGFAELATTLATINKIANGPGDAAKLAITAGALILVGGAILILAVALKIMSTIDTKDLVKSTAAVGALLTELSLFLKSMPDSKKMISTGAGLIGIALAITILAVAMKILASISAADLAKGATAIAALLTELVIALKAMPSGAKVVLIGVGLIAVAIAMNILAGAVAIFGTMDTKTMVQGLTGVAGALGIIALAVNLMPPDLPLLGAGLVAVGFALNEIGAAVAIFGSMNLGTMAQGLGGIAVALGILAAATLVMQGTILGSAAIVVAAGALIVLGTAVKLFSSIGIGSVILAMIGVAIALGVITAAALLIAPVLPELAGLAAALLLLGVGAAAFGAAAFLIASAVFLIAKAIEIVANVGVSGVKTLVFFVNSVVKLVPILAKAIVDTILAVVGGLADGLPEIIANFGKVFTAIFQFIQTQAPAFGQTMLVVIETAITTIEAAFPQMESAGFQLLEEFLSGLSNNIGQITDTAIAIVVSFLTELANHATELVDSGANVIVSFLNGIAAKIGDVVTAAIGVVLAILNGIALQVGSLVTAGANIIIAILLGLGVNMNRIITAGVDVALSVMAGIAANTNRLVDSGFTIVINLINGMTNSINQHAPELRAAGLGLAGAIIDGMTGGLATLAGKVVDKAKDVAKSVVGAIEGVFDINSPSKVMIRIAGSVAEGLVVGFDNDTTAASSATRFGTGVVNNLSDAMSSVSDILTGTEEFNPTITPVLDLTKVQATAKNISGMVGVDSLTASASFDQAALIAVSTSQNGSKFGDEFDHMKPSEVNFNQTINSPKQLSAGDIYRSTKSQITLAKEKLGV